MKVVVEHAPQGKVLGEYLDARNDVDLIMGPLGSGKTYQSCLKVMDLMCEQLPDNFGTRRSRWGAIRNTYPDLKTTTIKDWMELFGDLGLGRLVNDFPPTHYLDFDLEDGTRVVSEIIFLALDRPDSVKKLRGTQFTGFWLNEVKELQKEIVDMADGRHGRYPPKMNGCAGATWHGMIGDYNAPDTDHWLYKLAEETRPEGWRFHRQAGGVIKVGGKWVPNPEAENQNNLPKNYYLRQVASKNDDWVKVNLANEYGYVTTGKPIYGDDYNDALHTAPVDLAPMKKLELFLGFDFGGTPACIIGQMTPDGQLRILEELVASGGGIRKFMSDVVMPRLNTRYKKIPIERMTAWGDPSGVASDNSDDDAFNIVRSFGLDIEPTESNDPDLRWESVRYFLGRLVSGKPAFWIDRSCSILRKGFVSGYQFKRLQLAGEARFKETADKNRFSHPHDALQYLCQGLRGTMGHLDDAVEGYLPHPSASKLTGY